MKNIVLLFLLLLPGVKPACSQEKKEDLDLYLLIGQSNMAGRGKADQYFLNSDSIRVLDAYHQWQGAKEPLHFDKRAAGTGLAASFAMQVLPFSKKRIGLIPCAVGGTSITSWKPGAVDPATGKKPYDEMVARASEALKSGKIKAILWHQGESDTAPQRSAAYRENFEKLMNDIHHDLGIERGSVPVIIGELGIFPQPENRQEGRMKINETLHELASTYSYMACVSSAGLTHVGDHTHFDTPALRELGLRYAAAYRLLVTERF